MCYTQTSDREMILRVVAPLARRRALRCDPAGIVAGGWPAHP